MTTREEALQIVENEIGGIHVGRNGSCRWTDVAYALVHIKAQLRALPLQDHGNAWGNLTTEEGIARIKEAQRWLVDTYSCEGFWSHTGPMTLCEAIDAFIAEPFPARAMVAEEGTKTISHDMTVRIFRAHNNAVKAAQRFTAATPGTRTQETLALRFERAEKKFEAAICAAIHDRRVSSQERGR